LSPAVWAIAHVGAPPVGLVETSMLLELSLPCPVATHRATDGQEIVSGEREIVAALQEAAPPVGSVELISWLSLPPARHRLALTQSIASSSSTVSIVLIDHAVATVGLAELTTLPAASNSTHSEAVAHATPLVPDPLGA
jgi:hypothetical protein